jgi:hypothetical protein
VGRAAPPSTLPRRGTTGRIHVRFGWEADLPRPLEEIQALLEDPQHPLDWQPGLVRIESKEGQPGREGSVSRYVFDLDGTPYYLTVTVIADRLPAERVVRYVGRGMRNKVTMSLTPAGPGRTTFRAVHEGHVTGMQRLFALPLRKVFRQRWRVEFAELCRYLEQA